MTTRKKSTLAENLKDEVIAFGRAFVLEVKPRD